MTDDRDRRAAEEWLRAYHGSIDATALVLAYEAGASRARAEGAAEALRNVAAAFNGDETWTEIEVRDWLLAAAGPDRAAAARKEGT